MWVTADVFRKPFATVMLALVALTWVTLSIWSLSPYARYLNHEVLDHVPFTITFDYFLLLTIFVAGWVLMTIAMMLPTSLPLVLLFRRMTRHRANGLRLLLTLIGGYLAIWTLFGGLAHFGDLFVHEAVHRYSWLASNVWFISAAILLVGGLYQFSSLKYRCLDECRSPMSFISEHWKGDRGEFRSFWLGVRHGLFCVGCCWPLMLLMFAVACGNVALMLVLGIVMGIEKNLPWGRKLSTPLGVTMIAAGLLVPVVSLWVV